MWINWFLMLICPFWRPQMSRDTVKCFFVCRGPCGSPSLLWTALCDTTDPTTASGRAAGPEPTGPEPRPTVQMWIRLLFMCCSRCRLWRDARSCVFAFHFSTRRGKRTKCLKRFWLTCFKGGTNGAVCGRATGFINVVCNLSSEAGGERAFTQAHLREV